MANEQPKKAQQIEVVFAWIVTEPDGSEGIAAHEVMIDGRLMLAPLIGADRARIESHREQAQVVANLSGYPVRLVAFRARTVLEDAP